MGASAVSKLLSAVTPLVFGSKMFYRGRVYQVQEIYGIEDDSCSGAGESPEDSRSPSNQRSAENSFALSKECVVCMTDDRDTCCLPCRHMCLCAYCANVLRVGSASGQKCPLCRKAITSFAQVGEEDGRTIEIGTI